MNSRFFDMFNDAGHHHLAAIADGVGINFDGADSDLELKALRALKKRIGAKRSDKAFVVDVFVTVESRDKAARIADAIAQAYLDDQAEAILALLD